MTFYMICHGRFHQTILSGITELRDWGGPHVYRSGENGDVTTKFCMQPTSAKGRLQK